MESATSVHFLTGLPIAPPAPATDPWANAHQGDMGLTTSQLHDLANLEVSSGRLTREQVNEMLKADGAPELPVDNRTPEQKEIDAFMQPAKATDYVLPLGETDDPGSAEVLQVRGWLETAGFSASNGSAMAKAVAATAERYRTMSDVEKEVDAQVTESRLDRLWGAEKGKHVDAARRLVAELDKKSPGLADMLARTGAGNDVNVIVALANQAAHLKLRNGK